MKATTQMPWGQGTTIDFEADDLDDAMNRSIKFLLTQDDHLTLKLWRGGVGLRRSTTKMTPDGI
jgi:hypothetical protein